MIEFNQKEGYVDDNEFFIPEETIYKNNFSNINLDNIDLKDISPQQIVNKKNLLMSDLTNNNALIYRIKKRKGNYSGGFFYNGNLFEGNISLDNLKKINNKIGFKLETTNLATSNFNLNDTNVNDDFYRFNQILSKVETFSGLPIMPDILVSAKIFNSKNSNSVVARKNLYIHILECLDIMQNIKNKGINCGEPNLSYVAEKFGLTDLLC
ncbi:MAG: hypothetical protein GON13_00940 [Nanoarchaeota archaeon]|nr:hypothetical protein [Nanoarchaeota archaeon]